MKKIKKDYIVTGEVMLKDNTTQRDVLSSVLGLSVEAFCVDSEGF